MRNLILIPGGLLLSLLPAAPALAQAPESRNTYQLEFVLHDVENGKRVSSRNYSMLVDAGGSGYTRVGNKVAVAAQTGAGSSQIQYIDVGLNLECRVSDRPAGVFLNTSVEVSEVDAKTQGGITPQIRSVRTGAMSVVEPGKKTLLSGVDDIVGKRRYELEVTATRVK